MCEKDILFCIFYYLGYVAISGALIAGGFIIADYIKYKKEMEEREK